MSAKPRSHTTDELAPEGAKPAKTRDAERTRARLIQAARDVFVDHGFTGARTSAIAKKADVPQGLIYHYFKNKADLFDAVMSDALEPYFYATTAMLADPSQSSDLRLLERAIRMYFEFLQRNPHVVRLMTWWSADQGWEAGPPLGGNAELCQKPYELGAKRIREGQERGFIREGLDPVMVIDTFLELCMSWHMNFGRKCLDAGIDRTDGAAVDAFHKTGEDHIVSIVLRGVATPRHALGHDVHEEHPDFRP